MLSPELPGKMDAYWRAANYLSVGQIYLLDDPILKKRLRPEHIKPRLLGHWGTAPGHNFMYLSAFIQCPNRIRSIAIGFLIAIISACPCLTSAELEDIPEIIVQTGHTARITSLAFSPDGSYLVSGSEDKTVKLWEVTTGRLIRNVRGHSKGVSAVAFGPSSQWFASGSADGTIKIWDITKTKPLYTLNHKSAVNSIAISSSGEYIASAGADATVKLWLAQTGQEFRTLLGHEQSVVTLAFSPNGRYLASGDGNIDKTRWKSSSRLIIWDVPSGSKIHTFDREIDFTTVASCNSGAGQGLTSIAFTPGGRYLAVGYDDQNVLLWEVGTWRKLPGLLGHLCGMLAIAFSVDGRFLTTAGAGGQLWNLTREQGSGYGKEEPREFGGATTLMNAVSFSPNARYLATCEIGTAPGEEKELSITLWDAKTLRKIHNFPPNPERSYGTLVLSNPDRIVVTPAKNYLTIGSLQDGIDQLWDVTSGSKIHIPSPIPIDLEWKHLLSKSAVHDKSSYERLTQGLLSVSRERKNIAYSQTGGWVATVDFNAQVDLWQTVTGVEPHRISGGVWESADAVLFSPDGRWLAAGSGKYSNFVQLYNVESGLKHFRLENVTPRQIAFSPNSLWIASPGKVNDGDNFDLTQPLIDKDIELREISTGTLIDFFTGHTERVNAISFSSKDGRYLASGSDDRTVRIWAVSNKQPIKTLRGHTDSVEAVAFSPDNSCLASGSGDETIKLWDVSSWTNLRTLHGHEGKILAVAFSPDERFLVSGGLDQTVRLWDVASGRLMATLVSWVQSNLYFVFTPEGFFDGSSEAWQMAPFRFPSEPLKLYEPEQFFNQFYQPGLLGDIFREGKSMREILKGRKDPRADLNISFYRNSNLSEVRIVDPADGFKTGEREIQVTVEAKDTGSGIRDLRVFRNQTLVHFEHGDLTPNKKTKTYRLQVKMKLAAGSNEISAYCFNRDNIKSKDATILIEGADSLKREGTAYVLAIGINLYDNPNSKSWTLKFAVNDAVDIKKTLDQSFNKLNTYAQVVPVTLLDGDATKANIRAAFDLLSKTITKPPPSAPEELRKLKPAEPEDDIIVFFSGHGMANQNRYYLITHDVGYQGRRVNLDIDKAGRQTLMDHSVSDQDLNQWFEKIDAGRMMLIIDACYSGQALDSEEQRRGPMNSRGLAQLAYEKGIYLLAAAQSYETAHEPKELGHGLGHGALTYAILEEGLKKFAAATIPQSNQITAEEWLDYAIKRVKGQLPRAYYRRERVGNPWVIWQR